MLFSHIEDSTQTWVNIVLVIVSMDCHTYDISVVLPNLHTVVI